MKLLVSTKISQGKRLNDFCWVPQGEIVIFGSECDGESVDGGCGCRRSLSGIDCHKATTTMKIADVDITPENLFLKLTNNYQKSWLMDEKEANKIAKSDVKQLMRIVNKFNIGDIIEKRGNIIRVREL